MDNWIRNIILYCFNKCSFLEVNVHGFWHLTQDSKNSLIRIRKQNGVVLLKAKRDSNVNISGNNKSPTWKYELLVLNYTSSGLKAVTWSLSF